MDSYKFKLNGKEYEAKILSDDGETISLELNGKQYSVEMEKKKAVLSKPVAPSQPRPVAVSAPASAPSPAPAPTAGSKVVKSPLPGVVLSLRVNPGEQVRKGQIVMVLEAMKMENEIESTADGVVSVINKQKGDSVMEGDVLITLS